MTDPATLRQVQQHIARGQFALAAEVFAGMDAAYQAQVLAGLGQPRLLRLLETLPPDDWARLLEEIPAELAGRLLSGLSPAERPGDDVIDEDLILVWTPTEKRNIAASRASPGPGAAARRRRKPPPEVPAGRRYSAPLVTSPCCAMLVGRRELQHIPRRPRS